MGVVDEVLAKANDNGVCRPAAGAACAIRRPVHNLPLVAAQVAMRKRVRNKEFRASSGAARATQGRGCGGRRGGGGVRGPVPGRQGSRRHGGPAAVRAQVLAAARSGTETCGGAPGGAGPDELAPDRRRRAAANGGRGPAQCRARRDSSASRAGLEKLTIRAPIDGTILQIKARPGEVVYALDAAARPVLLGDTSALRVRAEVDERDH